MATVTTTPQTATQSVRERLNHPRVALALVLLYLAVVIGVLLSLNRGDLWFPTYSMLAFPAFILSPFIIQATSIDRTLKLILIVTLVLVVMPLIGLYDTGYLELAIQISIFTGLALGLNIVVGFAGLLDLGYIAFFAVGAYSWGVVTSDAATIFNINGWLVPSWAFFLFIFVGVGLAAVTGILLGLPVLRLRGDYLAIVTLGFGEMIRLLALNLNAPANITNGSQGLFGVKPPPLPGLLVDTVGWTTRTMGISGANSETLARQLFFYLIGVTLVGLIIVVARRLDDSPIGRAWTAIREDEVAAIAMGVPLVRMKLLAFAMGASFAGAIGVLYAAKQTFVSPESFSLIQSISILAMVIVGGMGGIRGVILGAIVVTLLNLQVLKNISLQINALRQIDFTILGFNIDRWPTQLEPAKYERLVFGLLLIVMMINRPSGILPEPRRRVELRQDDMPDFEEDDPQTPTVHHEPVVTGD